MNRSDNNKLICFGHLSHVGHDFEACCRVQSRSGFVEEQDFGGRNQLGRNTQSTLLTGRDTLLEQGTNKGICLVSQSEGLQELINSSDPLDGRNRSGQRELSGEVESLFHRKRPN